MFKKVFYNTGAQVIGKAVTATTTLLVTLLVIRSLGPAGYGDFTKIFVFVGYFYTLADFGLNSIFIKISSKNDYRLLSILYALRLTWAIFLVFLALTIGFLLPFNLAEQTGFNPLVKTGIMIASLTILTQALYTSGNAYFQKNLRYDLSTIAAILGSLTILTSVAIFTFSGGKLLTYVAAYVIGGTVMVATSYFLIFKRETKIVIPVFDIKKSLILVKEASPIAGALIFNLVYFRIDVFILAYFRKTTEVGLYGLSYQFFEAALAIPIFFANAIFPILNKLYKTHQNEFSKQVSMWTKILLAISIALGLALALIAFLIPVIDQRFKGSVPALQILAVGMPFFFLSALIWHLLIIYGRQKFLAPIYAVGALFNLLANLIFIPIYGYLAAAIVTVISEAFILLLLTFALRRVN